MRRRSHRRGSVMLWTLLGLPAVTGMLGLALDTGFLVVRKLQLENEVDTWARAELQAVFAGETAGPPEEFTTEEGWWSRESGFGAELDCDPGDACRAMPARRLVAEADVPLFFGPLVGVPSAHLSAGAVAATPAERVVVAVDVGTADVWLDDVRDQLADFFAAKGNEWLPGDEIALLEFAEVAYLVERFDPTHTNAANLVDASLALTPCATTDAPCASDHELALLRSAELLTDDVSYGFVRRTDRGAPPFHPRSDGSECTDYFWAGDASATRDVVILVHAGEPHSWVPPVADLIARGMHDACDIEVVPVLVDPLPPVLTQVYQQALVQGPLGGFQIAPDELADTLMAIVNARRVRRVE